jgi:geranylgeranyl diphosphate synthase type II
VATDLGLHGAIHHFQRLIDQAADSVPACTCKDMLQQLVRLEAQRLIPAASYEACLKQAPKASLAAHT